MKRNTKIVAAAVAAIPLAILGASTFCSWAISAGASMHWRLPFRILCHGMPERSLDLFGVPMPICARCAGIYLGLLVGLGAFLLSAAAPAFRRIWLLIAVAPLAIDGVTQAMGLRESVNPLRIATGLLAGMAFGLWVVSEVEHQKEHTLSLS